MGNRASGTAGDAVYGNSCNNLLYFYSDRFLDGCSRVLKSTGMACVFCI